VAINPAGQIYTFGEIAPPGDLFHVWTSQYDSNGTLLWDRHYDGNASGSNYAGGMSLTPSGGVVVCGTSDDIDSQGGVQNIVTIRYEPDGTQAWQRLERAGYAQAHGSDVAVDSLGNAYVTGYGFNKNNEEDMITRSYTPAGDVAWTQIYADPNSRSDRASAIAARADKTDDEVDVFVAGDAWAGFENYYDFTTIHYSIGPPGCSVDIDGSGAVDVNDLLAVVGAWGPCADPEDCPADVNRSGAVDIDDLLAVIGNWGPC
jgi:hypothetical protein